MVINMHGALDQIIYKIHLHRLGYIPFMGAGHQFAAVEGYVPVSSDEDVTRRMVEAAKRRMGAK